MTTQTEPPVNPFAAASGVARAAAPVTAPPVLASPTAAPVESTRHEAVFQQPVTQEPPAAVAPRGSAFMKPSSEIAQDSRAIDALLYKSLDAKASDLHLSVGTVPWLGIHGRMTRMKDDSEDIGSESMEAMLKSLRHEDDWARFEKEKRLDFSHATPRSRFRCHYAVSNEEPYAVFRTIPNEIPTFDALGLPAIVKEIAKWESGLVIFIGVTNSGKSSSMAVLTDLINEHEEKKIIGVESPVEYLHTHKKSMIVQREVGRDVESFQIGIEDAMREAPHVIIVGEMRDPETMSAAISAATSGHLVLATMHAESTADAPTRILDSMPAGRLDEVRSSLSRSLKAVIYQKLLPIKGGGGRVLAAEVMKVDAGISNMIRNNKLEGIQGKLLEKGSGCITFESSLLELVRTNKINERTAERAELREGSYLRLKNVQERL